jgi:RNA polymerase sigma-70 factor (ECF subfamily)
MLLLAFYGFFILAEGVPPLGSQPEGVQLNFAALGLMLIGFIMGWKREGTAAILIASGWTLWHISEGHPRWNLFQTPLPVAMLYAYCWWATQGRNTARLLTISASLAAALVAGRLFCPTSVFVQGKITDAKTGNPISNAELTLESNSRAKTLSTPDGNFRLYVGWYKPQKQVSVSAPGFVALTTNLGPRALGQREVSRNFALQQSIPVVPPVVIQTVPESGAINIDPALNEIRCTFSKPMQNGSWSWNVWNKENFPQRVGEPRYLSDRRTCVLPVKLEPGRVYAIWINSESNHSFKDTDGTAAMPYLLIFETRR